MSYAALSDVPDHAEDVLEEIRVRSQPATRTLRKPASVERRCSTRPVTSKAR